MAREIFEKKIKQIQDEILLLGSMVEQAALDSVAAFKNRDVQNAKNIIEDDQNINDKRFAIENAILILMATQQPLAHDLRLLSAMLLVANELERMGGLCQRHRPQYRPVGNCGYSHSLSRYRENERIGGWYAASLFIGFCQRGYQDGRSHSA